MKEIIFNATKNRIALVDDADYEELNRLHWYYNTNGYAYTAVWDGKTRKNVTKKMHQYLLKATAGLEIDHINGNKLDNQRANLRLCTHSQNGLNRPLQSNNKSGFRGVSWSEERRKWVATAYKNGRVYALGRYKTAKEAAKAYNQKALELHDDFAKLNKV